MITIPHYETSYFLFSNFSAHAIKYKGRLYPTLEHAFQAQKFEVPEAQEKIRTAISPLEAFKLGRSLSGKRPDWKKIKLQVMFELLQAKVQQHEEVKAKLLNTGNEEIIEENPNDSFWGNCLDGKGQNNMGKLLMKIREEVINS